jgi:hypothetical protein
LINSDFGESGESRKYSISPSLRQFFDTAISRDISNSSNLLGNPVRLEKLQGLNGSVAPGTSYIGAQPPANDDTSD